MGSDDVETFWGRLNDKDKVSSTSKEHVEYTGNNVDVDAVHTNAHVSNV